MIVLKELWKDASTTKGSFVLDLFLLVWIASSFEGGGPTWWTWLNLIAIFGLFAFAVTEYFDLRKELVSKNGS